MAPFFVCVCTYVCDCACVLVISPAAPTRRISSRWSVPAGKVKVTPPSSDDYNCWDADQAKAECSHRGFRLPAGTKTEARKRALFDDDEAKLAVNAVVSGMPSAGDVPAGYAKPRTVRSKNDIPRLCNCLFGNGELKQKLLKSGNQLSWQEMGNKTGVKFWDEVAAEYNDRTPSYRDHVVTAADSQPIAPFAGLDPGKALPWAAHKLHDLYKSVHSRYTDALAVYTKSGNHNPDFSNVSGGVAVDVLYLWHWIQHDPVSLSFVKGGLPQGTGVDSLRSPAAEPADDMEARRATKARRTAAAEHSKQGSEALAAIGQSLSGIAVSCSTTEEKETQEMLEACIEKITTWQKKLGEAAATDDVSIIQESVDYYKLRRTTLLNRLKAIETRSEV
eukprot:GHVU01084933.1.p2 GENE.GHVU01084933.1~~GHVU01084933.1.p2  ORF type:complete len:390 (-),score=54.67 GHVU01084933.1:1628-2797(-)